LKASSLWKKEPSHPHFGHSRPPISEEDGKVAGFSQNWWPDHAEIRTSSGRGAKVALAGVPGE
jgi:hypothetical protein